MAKIYRIPDNFIEGGKLFGGLVKTRNFIEAICLGCITGCIGLQFPVSSTTRISIVILFAAIGFVPGLIGVNDGPLSTYLVALVKWYRRRRVMVYNASTEARTDSITDRMLEAKTSQESFSDAINKLKPNQAAQEEKNMIEGIDFIFNTDEELSKYIEAAENSEKKRRGFFGKR